ncbi:hypothetical protein BDW72DRAFT_192427 [Aspergillus terricola var. indicus]
MSTLSVSLLQATQDLCSRFSEEYPNSTFLPGAFQYNTLSTENWSRTAWANPTCIVRPESAPEIQDIARLLSSYNVPFAVRSGGHMPSPLGANIDTGVLISLSGLDELSYDPEQGMVHVGAGLRWRDVYSYLDEYEVTVVGGRVLDVGVGGLILGGGLSYLSNLYGLVCDNVVNFEIVLANGSLINANSSSNKDLFWALKGGANNFGIVTSFTLYTYPIHLVWGGVRTYSLENLPQLLAAAYEFQKSEAAEEGYANFMLQAFTTGGTIGAVMNMVYLKPEPNPPGFAPFESIPTVTDLTKIQTLTDMMSGQRVPANHRWDWAATSSTPNPHLYNAVSKLMTTSQAFQTLASIPNGVLALGFQPISSRAVEAGNSRGGNALGLQNSSQTWLVIDGGWDEPEDDERVHSAVRGLVDTIETLAREDHDAYVSYIFMNDASWDQDVIGSYGNESVASLTRIQSEYDPEGVFQNLAPGGFKIG